MDRCKNFSQPVNSTSVPTSSAHSEPRQRPDVEGQDTTVARKVQKADREKLRRDRLNEQFFKLGNRIDPDRPKNDKATVLTDTVQLLKELTSEVNRLKAECASLTEESRELTQEKNELKEEKASLKSDIDNLNLQYQQRLGVMAPWAAMNSSVVMAPTYSFPFPLTAPPGSIPMHPSIQPFPFFGNHNPGAIPNPCSTFIPYPGASNPHFDQPSTQDASTSHVSSRQDSISKPLDRHRDRRIRNDEKSDDSDDVVTELELKTPGSKAKEETPPGDRKGKKPVAKDKSITDGSSSSRYSSSKGIQDSSYNNAGAS